MAIRYLIDEDGEPFKEGDLDALEQELDSLNPAGRTKFRDENASAIAGHSAEQILIVAGPGTGKSMIFKQRVLFWLNRNPAARILALSFVRKLVADLNNDIQNDKGLTKEQKDQVDIFTLHKYARSVVEQNHGTREWPFAPHFRVIGQDWKEVVWYDTLLLAGYPPTEDHSWKAFEKQVHDDEFQDTVEWKALKQTYFELCRYYNAAGFCDLILRARGALIERPELNTHQYFIMDEYQDFNISEEKLLDQIASAATGTLLVGDDDQVLYETLKSGRASLIRAIYKNVAVANAMLPFCGRCDFHITRTASHFIAQEPSPESISKIYLPISDAHGTQKVRVIGCASATAAVDYIRKFIEDHGAEIEQRRKELAAGEAKDAFLLVLSPSGAVDFYKPGGAQDQLFELVDQFRDKQRKFSDDYFKVLSYYSLANYPSNNFTFRKVLYYEGIGDDELLSLLKRGFAEKKPLSEIGSDRIKNLLSKVKVIKEIIEAKTPIAKKVEALGEHIRIAEPALLQKDLEKAEVDKKRIEAIEHQEEEEAELEEIEVKQMSAVELMTIVSSKGLSADHVIILGFDDVNLRWVTRNAFYVAMTRARRSLHLVTALRGGGATKPHGYLDQLPEDNLECLAYLKGKRSEKAFAHRNEMRGYLAFIVKKQGG